jgi:hypothetical protein
MTKKRGGFKGSAALGVTVVASSLLLTGVVVLVTLMNDQSLLRTGVLMQTGAPSCVPTTVFKNNISITGSGGGNYPAVNEANKQDAKNRARMNAQALCLQKIDTLSCPAGCVTGEGAYRYIEATPNGNFIESIETVAGGGWRIAAKSRGVCHVNKQCR